MPSLSEYSNVTNTVLHILQEKGYKYWYWIDEKKEIEAYCAEKNSWDFFADSPCGLLGLIYIYEFKMPKKYQKYWWRCNENVENTSPEGFLNYESYISCLNKKSTPALCEHSNVNNTVLYILQKKGYKHWFDNEIQAYCIEKSGWDFFANSPCALLGLIYIYEFKKPKKYREYWWRYDEGIIYDQFSKEPPNYHSIKQV